MGGLNPVRFYGSHLPRPRIYCDVKFNDARVDPPAGVNAALLEWAGNVPWRQGGTAVKRKRLQGKVEGRMNKLRNMEESDEEEEELPAKKPAKVQQQRASASSTKATALSPASGSRKVMNLTPIERMLSSPEAKESKAPPKRRILTQFNVQKTDDDDKRPTTEAKKDKSPTKSARKQTRIVESDSDSDDGLDAFLERLEASKKSDRGIRRSTRLQQGSPRTPSAATKSGSPKSGSPGSKDTKDFTPKSYTTPKAGVHDSALESYSESESDTESSQSQFF
jgi:hypothetical protein